MQIPFGKPMIGAPERAAVADVLEGNTLTHGPRVKEFEAAFAEFTGAPYAVATATCMAALHLAYLAIDLGPGDEVIVPAQTHVATAHAVEVCGAKPVFCDCEPATGNIDLDQLEGLIGRATPGRSRLVHYLGLPGGHGAGDRPGTPGTTCSSSRTAPSRSALASAALTSACSATSAASPSTPSSTSPRARAGW